MTNDSWTDDECRYFFYLYAEEKKKGNKTKAGMNQTGKEFIINKFEERFGKRHVWERFKNKYDISRKAYMKFKRLIHNRTGMGYDSMGRIDMSDDWWEARIAEWPEARKYKNKLIPNMDVFEAEFGAITVTGAEGWSAQQGEASLDSRMGVDNEDDSVSVDMDISENMVETSNRGGCSKQKKRRKETDPTESSTRNAILAEKNSLVRQMFEHKKTQGVEHALQILNELPGVKKWSAFHRASVDHLIADKANRQGFIAFSSVEDKISYLEHRTGIKLDD